jgi:uncharacterized protein
MSLTRAEVDTSVGLARVHVHAPAGRGRASAVLVLGHGAGAGVDVRDLAALASALPAVGITVVLVEQPWRVAGRRVAVAPGQLDRAWIDVMASSPVERALGSRSARRSLVVGGRSAGARVACRTAGTVGAAAVVALAFPLHPPGRPDRSRAEELLAVEVPTLVVQGSRDPFGGPEEIPGGPLVTGVPFADHGFAVPKGAPVTQAEALTVIVETVSEFVRAQHPTPIKRRVY